MAPRGGLKRMGILTYTLYLIPLYLIPLYLIPLYLIPNLTPTFLTMSNKARSVLKGIAVVLVLLAVVMQLGWVIIPSISVYKFWFVVIAFGLLLISSK
jgi:hypothetical protein